MKTDGREGEQREREREGKGGRKMRREGERWVVNVGREVREGVERS